MWQAKQIYLVGFEYNPNYMMYLTKPILNAEKSGKL